MNAVDQIFAEAERLNWLQLDLPVPPSVNAFTRRLGNQSPVVRRWKTQADMAFMLAETERKITKIKGPFEIELSFGLRSHWDLDNRIKPLLDYLQRIEVIDNDRFCERIEARRGGPFGRVIIKIRPWLREK